MSAGYLKSSLKTVHLQKVWSNE